MLMLKVKFLKKKLKLFKKKKERKNVKRFLNRRVSEKIFK